MSSDRCKKNSIILVFLPYAHIFTKKLLKNAKKGLYKRKERCIISHVLRINIPKETNENEKRDRPAVGCMYDVGAGSLRFRKESIKKY